VGLLAILLLIISLLTLLPNVRKGLSVISIELTECQGLKDRCMIWVFE
jgi:hypothetical protein